MIDINEEKNPELYYDLEKCMYFCKKINNTDYPTMTYFHMFWNVGLPFGRKQTLPIKSFLATQNQNNTKLIVWSNEDLTKNDYFKPFINKVEFKIYCPIEESKGTVLEGKTDILNLSDSRNWSKGDLFRILILHKYGGVYIDFDVVLLRDFAPLLNQEFMYKWGLETNMINGAIMRMFEGSKLTQDLLREIIKGGLYPNSTNWSTDLYVKVRNYNKEWTVFPSGFFNSEWADRKYYDTPLLPFKNNNWDWYEGAFSWHWHNKWDDEIEEGSKWEYLESMMDKILKEK